MIILDDIIIPKELKSEFYFCCNIKKCKGLCCVLGDAGAPLENEEIDLIQDSLEKIKPFMQNEISNYIDEDNFFDYDQDGNLVTSLHKDKECVFSYFEDGIAKCSIEKANIENKITIHKPISCYLYPIRIEKTGVFKKLYFHSWKICNTAITNGNRNKIKLIDFLKDPLIKRFGKEWYDRLTS